MKTMLTANAARLLMLMMLSGPVCLAQRYAGPLTPEESLKKIKVENGFKVQLYAAEPYTADPVGMEFDELGNAYVVELYDYPFEVQPGKGKSRIRLMKDTNGDGKIDKSVIFAENLTEATSILPWKGGIIVTAAPYILYLKDTNGDGKADTKEILFSGFFQDNSEAQVTSLRLGVDNWIYANNRGQAGTVTFRKKPGAPPISVSGADFRFRLDKNLFELETGPGQFGQTIDDAGHRYFTENSIHIQQSVIPWRYTHRHPYLPIFRFAQPITDHEEIMFQKTPAPYWRAERTARRNKMYQEAKVNRVEYADGHFTGAAGGTIYNGDGLPKDFIGNVFTCDVSGNLVHRDILTPSEKSPVMVAKRGDGEKSEEFLYSTDTWFRPITFSTGPDGYLYVLDYYRQHIETPVSIPDDLKADMDFMAGSDKGRIYRVLPENAEYKAVKVDLKHATSAKLVDQLANTNGWWRFQAHRLLLERQDKTVIPVLKSFIAKTSSADGRLHAMYVLDALNGLTPQIVKQALNDPSADVRENALMLAEHYPALLSDILAKTNDESNRVALQATLSAGNFTGKGVTTTLAKMVDKYGQDPWFRAAVLSSNTGSSAGLMEALAQTSFLNGQDSWRSTFIDDLSYIIGARNNKEQLTAYLTLISKPGINDKLQASAVNGLKKGLAKASKPSPKLTETLQAIKTDSANDTKEALSNLKKIY